MTKRPNKETLCLLAIIGSAFLFRFFHPINVELNSALIGLLTVLGVYILVKEVFDWQTAAISSFLMAVSLWPVHLSRMGFGASWAMFAMVYVFYFIWRGIKTNNWFYYVLAGILGGLGFYFDISFFIAPFIVIAVFLTYWSFIKKAFDHLKYETTRHELLKGFSILVITSIVMLLPAGFYFWKNPDQIAKHADNLIIWSPDLSFKQIGYNISGTIGIFNIQGDSRPEVNPADGPMLFWPIGILFLFGLVHEVIHWSRRKHGHFSPAHTLILSWFAIGLVPGFLSVNSPDALLTVGALAPALILAAKGLRWIFEKLNIWHNIENYKETGQSHFIVNIVMIIFLGVIGFAQFWQYFIR